MSTDEESGEVTSDRNSTETSPAMKHVGGVDAFSRGCCDSFLRLRLADHYRRQARCSYTDLEDRNDIFFWHSGIKRTVLPHTHHVQNTHPILHTSVVQDGEYCSSFSTDEIYEIIIELNDIFRRLMLDFRVACRDRICSIS